MVSVDVNRQVLSDQVDRCGHVFWFTGLSGAGKTTLARAADDVMKRQGFRTCVLDGDVLRQGLNRDLGFDEAARSENIRRAAEVARLMTDAGLVVLAAFISPYRRDREMARQIIGPQRFVEVFVDTPLSVCEQRDPKGLYRKARAGQLPDMTGIGSPYEAPLNPEMRVTPDDTVADVVHLCLLQCGNNGDA